MSKALWYSFGAKPASCNASLHRAQYTPYQSDFLMPVSDVNFICPRGLPSFSLAVRWISWRMCVRVMGHYARDVYRGRQGGCSGSHALALFFVTLLECRRRFQVRFCNSM